MNYKNLLKLKVMIERSKHHESEEFDDLLDEIKVNKALKDYVETKMFMLPSGSALGYGFDNLMLTVSTDEEKPSFQKLQFYWFMLDTVINEIDNDLLIAKCEELEESYDQCKQNVKLLRGSHVELEICIKHIISYLDGNPSKFSKDKLLEVMKSKLYSAQKIREDIY